MHQKSTLFKIFAAIVFLAAGIPIVSVAQNINCTYESSDLRKAEADFRRSERKIESLSKRITRIHTIVARRLHSFNLQIVRLQNRIKKLSEYIRYTNVNNYSRHNQSYMIYSLRRKLAKLQVRMAARLRSYQLKQNSLRARLQFEEIRQSGYRQVLDAAQTSYDRCMEYIENLNDYYNQSSCDYLYSDPYSNDPYGYSDLYNYYCDPSASYVEVR